MHAFHKSGAATAKALSPVVLADLISGLARVLLPTDLRLYLDCLKDKRLVIYVGAVPCTALKVNKITSKKYSKSYRQPMEVYHDWSDV